MVHRFRGSSGLEIGGFGVECEGSRRRSERVCVFVLNGSIECGAHELGETGFLALIEGFRVEFHVALVLRFICGGCVRSIMRRGTVCCEFMLRCHSEVSRAGDKKMKMRQLSACKCEDLYISQPVSTSVP